MSSLPVPTREAGLERIEAVVSRQSPDVSFLWPYLSSRLITEAEVARAALQEVKPKQAEPLLEELCRRTYWRGWLEGRPQLYLAWCRLLREDGRNWPAREDYRKAVAGETGIEVFDHWVEQIKRQGELSDEARTAFASIWLFTLKLPWSLGAAFSLRHLLDGDVAATLCGWRWVAGLHTRGSHHLTTAERIRTLSGGRFFPRGQLVEKATPLGGPPNPPYLPPVDFPFRASEQLAEDHALLLTPEDLSPEIGATADLKPKAIYWLPVEEAEWEWELDEKVLAFKKRAMEDAVARARERFGCAAEPLTGGGDLAGKLTELRAATGVEALVYYEPFVGPWKGLTSRLSSRDVGVRFFPLRRPWDGLLHPHAAKGYVHFRKHALPQITRAKERL